MGSSCPKEAVQKAGGHLELETGVRCGRIIRSTVNNMQLFFFPRYEYTKSQLYRQRLQAGITEEGGGLDEVSKIQDEQFGYNWDPTSLIPTSLMGSSQPIPGGGNSQPMLGGAQPTQPMSLLGGGNFQPMPLLGGAQPTQPMFGGALPTQPMFGGGNSQPMPMLGGGNSPMLGGGSSPMLGGGSMLGGGTFQSIPGGFDTPAGVGAHGGAYGNAEHFSFSQ